MKGGGRPTCPAAGEDAEEDRGPTAEGERGCWERKSETRSRRLYPQNAKPEEHFNVLFCTYIIK
jgi:hypothetical protein